jgi:hypothetical protein
LTYHSSLQLMANAAMGSRRGCPCAVAVQASATCTPAAVAVLLSTSAIAESIKERHF